VPSSVTVLVTMSIGEAKATALTVTLAVALTVVLVMGDTATLGAAAPPAGEHPATNDDTTTADTT